VSGFRIGDERKGMRLDVVLADLLGESRSRAAAIIVDGRVTVDGRPVGKNHRVAAGEHVEVADAGVAPPRRPAPPLPPVRYDDDHVLVVAKPAGLVVHPGHGNPDGTLVDALRAAGIPLAPAGGPERPGIVHRLDRDTSGLLVVAKTDEAHAGLVEELRLRRVERRYLALVDGVPPRARARVEAPIGRDPRDRLRFAVVATGREAVTRYEVLGEGRARNADGVPGEVSLLACRLETGRTHQIRVHLASLGTPVSGDATYRADVRLSRALGLTRPFLHAAALAFAHPVTGARVEVTEPLPADLRAAVAAAGLEAAVPEEA
jgi:23S rRNA pseudouridine1911/1915/1917 synthase